MKIDSSIYRDAGPLDDPSSKKTDDIKTKLKTPIDNTAPNQNGNTSVNITQEAKDLLQLQNDITNAPEVDKAKVMAARARLERGEFDVLSSTDAKLSTAERIADKLLDIHVKK
jgi:flagellar biosynthesis anti-sigma factor FlgM